MATANHIWHTPAALAARLDAHKTSGGWRARCPVHGGDNPASLSIREGKDQRGHPCTLLYCHAQQCDIQDICAALDIPLRSLWCVQPDYGRSIQRQSRSHDPRLERLRSHTDPYGEEDLLQLMLELQLRDEPDFLTACPPARQAFWRLWQDPTRKSGLVKALIEATLPVRVTLDALQLEWGTHVT